MVGSGRLKYAAVKKWAFENSNSCSIPELKIQRVVQVWTLHLSCAIQNSKFEFMYDPIWIPGYGMSLGAVCIIIQSKMDSSACLASYQQNMNQLGRLFSIHFISLQRNHLLFFCFFHLLVAPSKFLSFSYPLMQIMPFLFDLQGTTSVCTVCFFFLFEWIDSIILVRA